MNQEKPRWQYRFDNFKRAYFLLQEACEQYREGNMAQLAKEGMVQRFEVCMELAWKTIKDYMEYNNHVFAQVYPSIVIKEAFAAKLLDDGEAWLEALDTRNKMSHTYDFSKFEVALEQISTRYIQVFGDLYEKLAVEQ
jgi:nucleotidyltransferase substrate binding protein (TIGR01987 family)